MLETLHGGENERSDAWSAYRKREPQQLCREEEEVCWVEEVVR